jgi:hypothetical protein
VDGQQHIVGRQPFHVTSLDPGVQVIVWYSPYLFACAPMYRTRTAAWIRLNSEDAGPTGGSDNIRCRAALAAHLLNLVTTEIGGVVASKLVKGDRFFLSYLGYDLGDSRLVALQSH